MQSAPPSSLTRAALFPFSTVLGHRPLDLDRHEAVAVDRAPLSEGGAARAGAGAAMVGAAEVLRIDLLDPQRPVAQPLRTLPDQEAAEASARVHLSSGRIVNVFVPPRASAIWSVMTLESASCRSVCCCEARMARLRFR